MWLSFHSLSILFMSCLRRSVANRIHNWYTTRVSEKRCYCLLFCFHKVSEIFWSGTALFLRENLGVRYQLFSQRHNIQYLVFMPFLRKLRKQLGTR